MQTQLKLKLLGKTDFNYNLGLKKTIACENTDAININRDEHKSKLDNAE